MMLNLCVISLSISAASISIYIANWRQIRASKASTDALDAHMNELEERMDRVQQEMLQNQQDWDDLMVELAVMRERAIRWNSNPYVFSVRFPGYWLLNCAL
jgi:hypothetical protein